MQEEVITQGFHLGLDFTPVNRAEIVQRIAVTPDCSFVIV
jgi:hypothetical protein